MSISGSYYIVSITEENWKVVMCTNIFGVRSTAYQRAGNKIKQGDFIIFYISRKNAKMLGGKIAGIYGVASTWYTAGELLYPDEMRLNKLIYSYRIRIEPDVLGIADFGKLVPNLSFITNKTRWAVYLRETIGNFGNPIPPADVNVIRNSLTKLCLSSLCVCI